jgi:hypothetical protein
MERGETTELERVSLACPNERKTILQEHNIDGCPREVG